MEFEYQESEMFDYDRCDVDIIYFINNESQKKGKLNFDSYSDNISYKEIEDNFKIFLKEEDNNYFLDDENKPIYINFIRYFDGEGWILLKEDEAILLGEGIYLSNIKLMIKANILIGKKQKFINKYYKMVYNIKKIQDDLLGDDKNKTPDAPLNLIVLTSNPLMDGDKELRTMNDFNIITSKIYELFDNYHYLKYTEFLPLTMNTLIDILSDDSKRPVILHLICKSTYIEENNNDNQFANLIFEQDEDNENKSKYNLEFINKEKLEKIFNSNEKIKENIKKITLIISTPLAEDVYELFNNFGFKNLLVQHTTLADVNYIADFNYKFYFELIDKKSISINDLFYNINILMDKGNPPSFCCCNHKHKKDCNLIKNLKNELYNINNNNEINKLYLEKTIPHFYHLFPSCQSTCYNNLVNQNFSLSLHNYRCLKQSYFAGEVEKHQVVKLENKTFYNLCCCPKGKEVEQHTLNTIFFKNFNKGEKLRFRIKYKITKPKFVPNFSEMKLLVGQNKIVLKIMEFIDSDEPYNFYIHGNSIDDLKLLGNIIKEYYKEKNYYYNDEPDDLEEQKINYKMLKRMNNAADGDLNKGYEDLSNVDNSSIIWTKSSPNIRKISRIKKFENFDLNDDDENNNILEFNKEIINGYNNNKIYFIYVFDNKLVKDVKLKINDKKIKIIWFYKDILEDKDIEENINKIEFNYEKVLKKEMYDYELDENNKEKIKISPNLYIQFQNKKALRDKWRKNNIFVDKKE